MEMNIREHSCVGITAAGKELSNYLERAEKEGRHFVVQNRDRFIGGLVNMHDLRLLSLLKDSPTESVLKMSKTTEEVLREVAPTLDSLLGLGEVSHGSVIGVRPDQSVVSMDFHRNYIIAGSPGSDLEDWVSAAVAGATVDAEAEPVTFVAATMEPSFTLRHRRSQAAPAVIIAADLEGKTDSLHGQLQQEFELRKDLLRDYEVASIAEYRRQFSDHPPVPHLVVILDQADLILSNSEGLTALINRLLRNDRYSITFWLFANALPESLTLPRGRGATRIDKAALSRAVIDAEMATHSLPPGEGILLGDMGVLSTFKIAKPDLDYPEILDATCRWGAGRYEPVSLFDLAAGDDFFNSPPGEFTIGQLVDKEKSPFKIDFDETVPHLLLLGQPQSGRTTTLKTLMASAVASEKKADFFLIDFSADGALADCAELPNVGAYADGRAEDRIERIIGEFTSTLSARKGQLAQSRARSWADYAARSESVSLGGFSRMFLVIDDAQERLAEYLDHTGLSEQLESIVLEGGKFGLHIVLAATKTSLVGRVRGARDSFQVLPFDATSMWDGPYIGGELRAKLQRLPAGYPGLGVDLRTGRHRIIAAPVKGPVARGEELQERVQASLRELSFRPMHVTPKLEMVPAIITPDSLWQSWSGAHPALAGFGHPLGVDRADTSIHAVGPDEHLVALGDPGKGKSTLLRSMIDSITRQYSPEEARIVLVDPMYQLVDQRELLSTGGYLLGYADGFETLEAAMRLVEDLIEPRFPNSEVSVEQLRNRSWYSGPRVFVLIDDTTRLTGKLGTPSPLDYLVSVIQRRNDVGLNVFCTGITALPFDSPGQPKLYRAIYDTNAPFLLFGGNSEFGSILPGHRIKFQKRPAGEALLARWREGRVTTLRTTYTLPADPQS